MIEIEFVVNGRRRRESVEPRLLLSDYIRQRDRSLARTDGNMKLAVRQLEQQMIREAMERFQRNKSRAARSLGISRQSLIEKLKAMDLSPG